MNNNNKRKQSKTRTNKKQVPKEPSSDPTVDTSDSSESSEPDSKKRSYNFSNKSYQDSILADKNSSVQIGGKVKYKYRGPPTESNTERGVIKGTRRSKVVILKGIDADVEITKANVNANRVTGDTEKRENTPVEEDQIDSAISVPPNETSELFFKVKGQTLTINRKLVLESAPDFAALFSLNDREIVIDDVEHEVFNTMLKSLKNESINFAEMEQQHAIELIKATSKYKLGNLKAETSEHFFEKTIGTATVVDYLLLADEHKLEKLNESVFKFIKDNPSISKSQEFKDKIVNSTDRANLKRDLLFII